MKKSASVHPALSLLFCKRWDDAFAYMHHVSEEALGPTGWQRPLDVCGDRQAVQAEIREAVDALYVLGTHQSGELALGWAMLACRPSYPASFRAVLPQLQYTLDSVDLDSDDDGDARDRLRIWWRAASGEFTKQKRSMFALAAAVLAGEIMQESMLEPSLAEAVTAKWFASPHPGPTMVVMPASRSSKLNNYNKPFAEILDKPLPLVVARNLDDARKRLSYEFPHAHNALQTLFRDLREGEPAKLKNTILVGPPGVSKSRLARKVVAAAGWRDVTRYQADASADGHFAGTSKGWANTEASVPARALLHSKTANPLVLIDEIDKAASNHHGGLFNALLSFADVDTARNYRDQSTDCEFDCSMVSYLCTANDVGKLPDHLRDRFRILRVPAPTLVDLPLLAASIMEDLAREDPERVGDEPLAKDELMVMAKAWQASGPTLSIRKLQKIVAATLQARDEHAMRH